MCVCVYGMHAALDLLLERSPLVVVMDDGDEVAQDWQAQGKPYKDCALRYES